MKSIVSIAKAITILLLCVSCSKPNAENRGDLSGLPSFEYQGYTYFIHNNIGKFCYADASEKVSQLSSYGYTSWFIPTIDELNIALDKGLISVYSDYKTYATGYWSSSQSKSSFNWILSFDQFDNQWEQTQADLRVTCWTLPMIRVRQ